MKTSLIAFVKQFPAFNSIDYRFNAVILVECMIFYTDFHIRMNILSRKLKQLGDAAQNAVKPVGNEKNWYDLIVISWRKNRLMISN